MRTFNVDGTGGCLIFLFLSILAISVSAAELSQKDSLVIVRHIDGPRYYKSEVVHVVDGDTVDLKFDIWVDISLIKRIRFADVDTWEVTGNGKEKGLAAKKFLIDLLDDGIVYLKTDGKVGKYGRTIGSLYVLVGDTMIDVSEEIKKNGHEKIGG